MNREERATCAKCIALYCEGIILSIDSERECGKLEDFVARTLSQQNEVKEYLEETAIGIKEHRDYHETLKDSAASAYTNQMCMNKVYELFTSMLPDINKAYSFIKSVHGDPYSTIINKFAEDYYKEMVRPEEVFTIIGSRTEYEHRNYDYQTNTNDVKKIEEDVRYYIVIKHEESGEYFELECYSYEDICCSGYCPADYVSCEIKRIDDVRITARYKGHEKVLLYIRDFDKLKKSELNTIFDLEDVIDLNLYENDKIFIGDAMEISFYGGDMYYSEGYVNYNPDVFTKVSVRQFDAKPVWIFKGDSGAGKTYLTDFIVRDSNKTKLETDAYEVLPDKIIEDIVVIGNKCEYDVEDITSRIPLTFYPIIVDFTKMDKVERTKRIDY